MSAAAIAEKGSGNQAFKGGDYVTAIRHYTQAILLDNVNAVLPLNRAMCYLKLAKFDDAERDCTAALKLQPRSAKALYRRALARKGQLNYISAISDLQEAKIVEPINTAVGDELAECQRLLKEAKEQAKAKAAKAAAVRARSSPAADAEPVASTSKATVLSESDPTLMREVSTRKILKTEQANGFGAAREQRQAKEQRQRSALGLPAMSQPAFSPAPRRAPAVAVPVAEPRTPAPQGSADGRHRNKIQDPVDKGPIPARVTPSAYDFRRAWIEIMEGRRQSGDWHTAWRFLASIKAADYGTLFENNLEPDLLAQMLQVMDEASAASPSNAKLAVPILSALPRSPRFDFVTMLLADAERQSVRDILDRGCADVDSTTRTAWAL